MPAAAGTNAALMKSRATRPRRSSILLAGIVAACFTASAPAVVLTSNLSLPQDGLEAVSTTRWLGSEFKTDGSYLIDSITLRIQRNAPGTVQVSLYSDASGQPGQLLATLNTGDAIGGSASLVTFRNPRTAGRTTDFTLELSGSEAAANRLGFSRRDIERAFGKNRRVTVSGAQSSGLGLAPGTNYWVVTRALSGSFSLGYTDQETGEGPGYSPAWAQSNNAGVSWSRQETSPLFLEILANPSLLLDDQEAIFSAVFSGLPMALAQREAVFTAVRNVTRDVNARLFRLRTDVELPDVAEAGGKKAVAVEPESRWEVYATASYGYADHETFLPAVGFETDTWAETIGAEFEVNEHFAIGAAFTYTQSNNATAMSVGDVDLEGEAITAYASWHDGGFYADALYSYAMFEHDIQRDTLFGNTASAEPNSRTHTLQLNLGYNIPVAGFVTGPYASIDWMIGELENYEEANGNTLAGSARLRVPGQTFDSLISRIGWQISRTYAIESVKLTPQLRAAWAHEYRDELEFVDVQLATSPFKTLVGSDIVPVGRFTASAETQDPGSDVFEVGFTLGIQWDERFRMFVDYTAHLFQNHAFAHQVSLTGEVKF